MKVYTILHHLQLFFYKRIIMASISGFLKASFYGIMFLLIAPQLFMALYKQYGMLVTPHTKIGIISFNHSLSHSGEYVRNLKKFFKDHTIKAIFVRMDCPGGAAGTSQAIFNELTTLKKQYPHKPVVVFVENICASGGYYIASGCDWIIATASAFVGSIGVYIAAPQLKEFINQFKIEYAVTKTGKYKTILNPLIAPVEGEKAILQNLCDDTYQQFIEDVAKSRPQLLLHDASVWADGKIFTGRQALQMKLIDQLGSLSDVEAQLRERAHIPASQEIEWVKAEQKNFIMKLISPEDPGESNEDLSLTRIVKNFCHLLFEHTQQPYF